VINDTKPSSGGAKRKERSSVCDQVRVRQSKAVKFYRDVLGLQLKFDSPGWSKFMTGETAQLVNRPKELLFAVPELALQQ